VDAIGDKPVGHRANIFIARLCFRGIYFPQMGKWEWTKVIAQNRRTIFKIVRDGLAARRRGREMRELTSQTPDPEMTV
jgi:hypothetical protein